MCKTCGTVGTCRFTPLHFPCNLTNVVHTSIDVCCAFCKVMGSEQGRRGCEAGEGEVAYILAHPHLLLPIPTHCCISAHCCLFLPVSARCHPSPFASSHSCWFVVCVSALTPTSSLLCMCSPGSLCHTCWPLPIGPWLHMLSWSSVVASLADHLLRMCLHLFMLFCLPVQLPLASI